MPDFYGDQFAAKIVLYFDKLTKVTKVILPLASLESHLRKWAANKSKHLETIFRGDVDGDLPLRRSNRRKVKTRL